MPVCDPPRTWQFSDCFVPAPVGGLQVLASPNEERMQEDGGERSACPSTVSTVTLIIATDNTFQHSIHSLLVLVEI